MHRIGHGYDFHRYAEGRKLFLGGVEIPHRVGLEGHSDADVLIHALCDALLGAVALGDIGKHFPDTDPAYKGIASRKLLQSVRDKVKAKGFKAVNVDMTVIADHPKIAEYVPQMRRLLAEDLGIDHDCVGIKATTKEGCAPEGIAAHSVVLLESL